MSNYELHKESIGPEVWDDIEGLKSYLADLRYDKELCNGMSFHSDYDALITDVMKRIAALEYNTYHERKNK